MDVSINNVVFEPDDELPKTNILLPDIEEDRKEIMLQLLQSGCFFDNTFDVSRFLLPDRTIDIEKLELAVILAVEYLEFSVKSKTSIYIYLNNFDAYFKIRGLDLNNVKRATEERNFIKGFCQAVADENCTDRTFIVEFDKRGRMRK